MFSNLQCMHLDAWRAGLLCRTYWTSGVIWIEDNLNVRYSNTDRLECKNYIFVGRHLRERSDNKSAANLTGNNTRINESELW